jgi:hypothetical protein
MKEQDKIKFKDLGGWLKALVIIAWIYLIATFLKENPYFTEDILSLIPIPVKQVIFVIFLIWVVVWWIKNFIRIIKKKK